MNLKKFKMAAGGHFGKQLKKRVCTRGIFGFFFGDYWDPKDSKSTETALLALFFRRDFIRLRCLDYMVIAL